MSRGIGKERGQVTADGGRRAVENSSVGAGGTTAEERCRDNHQSTPGEPAGRAEGPFNCAQNLMQCVWLKILLLSLTTYYVRVIANRAQMQFMLCALPIFFRNRDLE